MNEVVNLDRGDFYELSTLLLREQLAAGELDKAKVAARLKLQALAEAHQFDAAAKWTLDDATCSLVARG